MFFQNFAIHLLHQEVEFTGFPGGEVVKNPPANAGDTGWSPGPGRFPHAMEQLPVHHSY